MHAGRKQKSGVSGKTMRETAWAERCKKGKSGKGKIEPAKFRIHCSEQRFHYTGRRTQKGNAYTR